MLKLVRFLLIAVPLPFVMQCVRPARAQQAFFTGLGDLTGGIFESRATDASFDGSVVVGWGLSDTGYQSFRWSRQEGLLPIAQVEAPLDANERDVHISGDGETLVATGPSGPFKWTEATGVLPLSGTPAGVVRGINHDGSVAVGQASIETGVQWTADNGYNAETLFGGPGTRRVGWDVTADGNTILGRSGQIGGFLWTTGSGVAPFPAPPEGGLFGGVDSITPDGQYVVGYGTNDVYRWSEVSGYEQIPPLANGASPTRPSGVSADGSVVVGWAQLASETVPFIWDPTHGSRNLFDVLTMDYGLGSSLAGWNLTRAQAFGISGDGKTIVGWGRNPDGNREAWVAFLGTPVPEPNGCLLCALALAVSHLRMRAGRLRAAPSD